MMGRGEVEEYPGEEEKNFKGNESFTSVCIYRHFFGLYLYNYSMTMINFILFLNLFVIYKYFSMTTISFVDWISLK